MYQNFAMVADQEGFKDIAAAFREIAKVEHFHESRYQALAKQVKNGTFFTRGEPVTWTAPTAAILSRAMRPRKSCPACKHPRAYYEVLAENYR